MQHRRSPRRRSSLLSFPLLAAASLLALCFSLSPAHAQATLRARAAAEKQRHGPALMNRLKTAPIPYALYARAPFDPIRSESTPAPTEVLAQPTLRLFACAEETEPTTFAVFAGRDLKDATVTIHSPFLSESKQSRLPPTAIDIHVIKPLEATGPASANEVTPELLLKDDRTPLVGPLPTVRLSGNPRTDIPAGTSKQFWITVRVPRGQPPSTFTGRLLFSATGVKPTPITMAVEVLPMRLRSPFLQYGMDFGSRLSGDGAAVVTPERFARQLANIQEHGFRFVSLYDPPAGLAEALKVYGQSGLNPVGPIVLMSSVRSRGEVERIERLRAELGLRPELDFYYRIPDDPEEAARLTRTIREVNRRAQTVAPITSQATFEALQESLAVPIYSMDSEYVQRLLKTGQRENPKRDWWSWNIAETSPWMNRLNAGFLLYRTGLKSSPLYGAFPGPYQELTGGDPYSDTAPRPRMVAYPAQDGVIDTLQWEATREGVDDIRYITNLMTYLREVKDLKIRKEVTDEAEAFLQKTMARPLRALPPLELQTIRRSIANRALVLLTILRGNAKRYVD